MTESQTIVIVEDETKIAQVLTEFFTMEGFNTIVIDDGGLAVEAIKQTNPVAVILDLMLPNKSGLVICREVRAFSQVPILMLTARVEEVDRLMGLTIGADDYVCKPFSPREVVVRVQNILRRTRAAAHLPDTKLRYKNVVLDQERFRCEIGGKLVELTRVEFRLFYCLLNKPASVCSRDELIDSCYEDGRVVSSRTVDSHMKNLRRKVEDLLVTDCAIHSVYGVGYKVE